MLALHAHISVCMAALQWVPCLEVNRSVPLQNVVSSFTHKLLRYMCFAESCTLNQTTPSACDKTTAAVQLTATAHVPPSGL
jgi:hypothetical protein